MKAPALLSREDLKTLKAQFSKDRLGVKVQSTNRDRTRAMLVLYLQHTDVQDRLEEIDPAWSTEVTHEERSGDSVYVRMKLTLKGVTRENVGEGQDPKAAYSDALKRCAMLFGVGRYLYDSPTVWVDYDESRDRYRQWTPQDYDAVAGAVKPASSGAKSSSSSEQAPASTGGATARGLKTQIKKPAAGAPRSRDELNRQLMNLYRPYLTQFPQTQFSELLQERYNVGETRLMTVEQLDDFVRFLEEKLRTVA